MPAPQTQKATETFPEHVAHGTKGLKSPSVGEGQAEDDLISH